MHLQLKLSKNVEAAVKCFLLSIYFQIFTFDFIFVFVYLIVRITLKFNLYFEKQYILPLAFLIIWGYISLVGFLNIYSKVSVKKLFSYKLFYGWSHFLITNRLMNLTNSKLLWNSIFYIYEIICLFITIYVIFVSFIFTLIFGLALQSNRDVMVWFIFFLIILITQSLVLALWLMIKAVTTNQALKCVVMTKTTFDFDRLTKWVLLFSIGTLWAIALYKLKMEKNNNMEMKEIE